MTSFCHRYDIPVINILTGELYKKQGALLEDISECIAAIEFPYPVYESEIASLAMLFLAHVPRKQFDSRLRVLLVCSSNDGLENYLKNEILSLSDKIDIMQVLNTTDSGTINGACLLYTSGNLPGHRGRGSGHEGHAGSGVRGEGDRPRSGACLLYTSRP